MSFNGQSVVVVGGGSGIGKAVAAQTIKAGADVIISSRDSTKLTAAIAEFGAGKELRVDMTQAASVAAWAEALPAVDHLVISASSAAHGPFAELSQSDLHRMFDAKFFGPYAIAKAALGKRPL